MTVASRRSSALTPSNILLAAVVLAGTVLTLVWLLQALRDPSLADRLDQAAEDSVEMQQRLASGDIGGAEEKFYELIHPLSHEVDFDLRQRDPELGQQLWDNILAIEFQLAGPRDSAELQRHTGELTGLLQRSKAVLVTG